MTGPGFATVDQRDTFDEDVGELERIGAVDLVRSRRGPERVVTGIRLKDAAPLYARVNRQPAVEIVGDALSGLKARHSGNEAIAGLLGDAAAAWSRGVSFAGVAVNDVRTLEQVIALACAVQARATQTTGTEVDFRTFSRLSVGDSKALERNVRAVVSRVPRIYGPEHGALGLEPEEYLGSLGIRRLPQPVLMRGPIALCGERLPAMPFIGIPPETAKGIELVDRPDYVLTVENYASFVRHVREVASLDSGLVVYSAGFPSRPTLNLIARLAAEAKAPTFHWGDMDAGGVRIFHQIERRLASVGVELQPHLMTVDLLLHVGSADPEASRSTGDASGSALADLAEVIVRTGLVHEQEELDPRAPASRANA